MNALKTIFVVAALAGLSACGGDDSAQSDGSGPLSGKVQIDGSSTVYPITEAIAEEFNAQYPRVRVTVGVSGTGGGFKKFAAGETDINNASRTIKDKEVGTAASNQIEFIELPVAYDGLTVVVHPSNDWATDLTVAELNSIWKPGSTINNWNQIRAGFPDLELNLYGPGTDSGTFDYFTEVVNGKAQACRADFTASEDDNVLVQGVGGDRGSMGFFGYAYYAENQKRVRAVAIDGGNGPMLPTMSSINDGSYAPLSRPIFIYVNQASLERVELRTFVDFYLENATELVPQVGYVPLPADQYQEGSRRVGEGITGRLHKGHES